MPKIQDSHLQSAVDGTGAPVAELRGFRHTGSHRFPALKTAAGAIHPDLLAAVANGVVVQGDTLSWISYYENEGRGAGSGELVASGTGTDDGGLYLDVGALQLRQAFGDTLSVRQFGARGDGASDDTASLEAAVAVAASTQRKLFIENGTYQYTGAGISLDTTLGQWLSIEGESRAFTIINNTGSGYLFNRTAGGLGEIDWSNFTVDGGAGLLLASDTGINSFLGAHRSFANLRVVGFTECGWNLNASDAPYFYWRECYISAASDTGTIGIALNELPNGSAITDCEFINGQVNIKLRSGDDVEIRHNTFFRSTSGGGVPAGSRRVNIWVEPSNDAQLENHLTILDNKFGNENLDGSDIRVLYADPLAGANNGTQLPDLDNVSDGMVRGHELRSNLVASSTNMWPPLVYSTTPHIHSSTSIYAQKWHGWSDFTLAPVIEFHPDLGLAIEHQEFLAMKRRDGSGFSKLNPDGCPIAVSGYSTAGPGSGSYQPTAPFDAAFEEYATFANATDQRVAASVAWTDEATDSLSLRFDNSAFGSPGSGTSDRMLDGDVIVDWISDGRIRVGVRMADIGTGANSGFREYLAPSAAVDLAAVAARSQLRVDVDLATGGVDFFNRVAGQTLDDDTGWGAAVNSGTLSGFVVGQGLDATSGVPVLGGQLSGGLLAVAGNLFRARLAQGATVWDYFPDQDVAGWNAGTGVLRGSGVNWTHSGAVLVAGYEDCSPAALIAATTHTATITGDATTTTFSVTHSLGTEDVSYSIRENSTGALAPALGPAVAATDANTISVEFDVAPAIGEVYTVKVRA